MARYVASGLSPVIATVVAISLAPSAAADRKHPAPIEYVSLEQGSGSVQTHQSRNTSSVPRPSSAATPDPWRGPVTLTNPVQLPAEREKFSFSYPGTQPQPLPEQHQYASVESSPRASLPATPARLWPAEASSSPLEASKVPAVQTLTLGDKDTAEPQEPASSSITPKASDVLHEERGLASWYGEAFHGQPTANGEVFDMHAMTAAHRTLPLPSLVQVVNESNGKEIVVRVNDRGPFAGDRIIDLSQRAASALGIVEQGEAPVVVRYLGPAPAIQASQVAGNGSIRQASAGEGETSEASTRMSRPNLYGEMLLGGMEPSLGVPDPGSNIATPARLASTPPVSAAAPTDVRAESLPPLKAYSPPAVRTVSAAPSPRRPAFNPAIYVQIGAFADIGNAQGRHAQVGGMFPVEVEDVQLNGADYFRVLVGPFPTRDAAERARVQLRTRGIGESFVALR